MIDKICEQFREHICEYIDAQLSQAEMEKFKAHIEQCDSCRNFLNEISSLTSSVTEVEIDIPQELHNSIMNKIKLEKYRKRSLNITKFVKIFSASTAALFCLFCVLTFVKLNYTTNSDGLHENYSLGCTRAKKSEADNKETKAQEQLYDNAKVYEFVLETLTGENYTEESIIGIWIDKDGLIFDFRENGEIVLMDTNNKEYHGEYELLPQKTISLTFDDSSIVSMIYKFDGNKLEMSITGGSLPIDR